MNLKKTTEVIMLLFYDFISLFFPRTCESCGNTLLKHENCICSFCLIHLPKTDFHLFPNNPVSSVFWGRVKINYAGSFLYFNKGSKVQHLIHGIKYKGKKEVGIFLGQLYGNLLKNSEFLKTADILIPVPLHPKKKRTRGYNQSEKIAIGISISTGYEVNTSNLIKTISTGSQTRRSRFGRWDNVNEVFQLKDKQLFTGKHVIIVDDVITTGATLEACINELLKTPDITVSVLTIACAIK